MSAVQRCKVLPARTTGMPHRASQCQSMLHHAQPCPTAHIHTSSCSHAFACRGMPRRVLLELCNFISASSTPCIHQKYNACSEEWTPLNTKCLSPPAHSELMDVGGLPSATAAPRQRSEPRCLHSAGVTSCGTRHHTACTLRPGSR
jgi:hypothetical protein